MTEQKTLRNAYWLTSDQKEQLARQSGLADPYNTLIVIKPEPAGTTGTKWNPGAAEIPSGFKDVQTGQYIIKHVAHFKSKTEREAKHPR